MKENIYYKDVNNLLNPFVGTWKYESDNTVLMISLIKKEHIFNDVCYEDILVGEYSYEENGTEMINTLPLLDTYSDVYDHNLSGNRVVGKNSDVPDCDDCLLSERRISLTFYDPDPNREHLYDAIVLRHVIENDIERIEAVIYRAGTVVQPEDQPDSPRVPYGAYTLIKQ